ncbi:MAG: hypothetical protein JW983_05970 [Elusimicrobia bacterium]|nr:hypothetical protein [Elusimicrobiota bacterium]
MLKRIFSFTVLLFVIFCFGCAHNKNIKSSGSVLKDSEYVVVKPVLEKGDESSGENVKCSDGKTVCVAKDVLLDMSHFETDGVYTQPAYNRIDRCTIIIPLTGEGAKIFEDWTSKNISKKIGIFVGGKLEATPEIKEVYSGPLVIEGEFPRLVADEIQKTIIAKGKP